MLSNHSLRVKAMKASLEKTVEQTAAKHAASQGGLLPCLHEIQAELGYIPNAHLENIATAFSLSTAEVHGVVTFYHDFRTSPSAPQSIQICCAEACQASGLLPPMSCRLKSLSSRVRSTVGVSWIPVCITRHKLRLLGLKRSHYLIARFRYAMRLITRTVELALPCVAATR